MTRQVKTQQDKTRQDKTRQDKTRQAKPSQAHVYTNFNQTPARSGYTAQGVGGWREMQIFEGNESF